MIPDGSLWKRMPLICGAVGVLGVGVSFLLRSADPGKFYFSWLAAFLFWLSVALGGLFFVLVLYATKAGWGVVVRRLSESTLAALPVLLLLFVPVLLGLHDLFHWSDVEAVAHDHLLAQKEPFLNPRFFTIRAVLYFAVWSLIGLWYLRGSLRQDVTGDPAIVRRRIFFSGPAIIVFAVTLTLAAFDWAMSLDPHWSSTIFGVYYFSGCLVGFFAFIVLLAALLHRAGYLEGVMTVEHFHDLGKLLFAFTVFWAYIAFSQFFLIWYGNIPEETLWYLHRLEGSWRTITVLLAVGHFGVPFLFLMSRNVKRRTGLLVLGALWMLLMHLIDVYWLVMPTLYEHGPRPGLLTLTTWLGIGGLFLAAVTWVLGRHALVPVRDPRLIESLSFQNF
jgi:hypothetical protein